MAVRAHLIPSLPYGRGAVPDPTTSAPAPRRPPPAMAALLPLASFSIVSAVTPGPNNILLWAWSR